MSQTTEKCLNQPSHGGALNNISIENIPYYISHFLLIARYGLMILC